MINGDIYNGPTTPETILVCDHCHQQITDIGIAMVFWGWAPGTPDISANTPITGMALAHKGAACAGARDFTRGLSGSLELSCFADPKTAQRMLAAQTVAYRWSAEQLRRWILIAWAVPFIGRKYRKASIAMADLI